MSIDWNALVDQFADDDGKVDTKAAIKWFSEELMVQIQKIEEEYQAEANLQKNLESAIHKVFNEAGKNILPRPLLTTFVLQKLNVGINGWDRASAKVEEYLVNSNNFGSMLGPSGGTVRVKDSKGKETPEYLQYKDKIHFGRIVRKRKGTE